MLRRFAAGGCARLCRAPEAFPQACFGLRPRILGCPLASGFVTAFFVTSEAASVFALGASSAIGLGASAVGSSVHALGPQFPQGCRARSLWSRPSGFGRNGLGLRPRLFVGYARRALFGLLPFAGRVRQRPLAWRGGRFPRWQAAGGWLSAFSSRQSPAALQRCSLKASHPPTLHEAAGALRFRFLSALSPPLGASANCERARLASLRSAAGRVRSRADSPLSLRAPYAAWFRSVSWLAFPARLASVPPLTRRSAVLGAPATHSPMSPVPRASSPNRSAVRFRSRPPRTALRAEPTPRDGHMGRKRSTAPLKNLK